MGAVHGSHLESAMTLSEFLYMGGHAPFVWSAWGISMAAVVVIFIVAKRRNARIRRELIVQLKRKEKFEL